MKTMMVRQYRTWCLSMAVALLALALGRGETAMNQQDEEIRWKTADIEEVDREREEAGRAFLEFIRVPDLSVGLYVLEAGAEDRQQPHGEDEIYYVLEGKGILSAGGEDSPVATGSIVYVKAQVDHRFHSIEKKLKILVVFAPAFGSAGAESGQ